MPWWVGYTRNENTGDSTQIIESEIHAGEWMAIPAGSNQAGERRMTHQQLVHQARFFQLFHPGVKRAVNRCINILKTLIML